MARQGICKNYGNCYLADQRQLQSLDTSNGICQNDQCGSKLTEITVSYTWIKIGILILLILILSGILWNFIPPKNDITEPEPPQPVEPIKQFRTKMTEIQGEMTEIQEQIDASEREIGKMSSVELINKLKNIQNSIEQLSKSIEQLPINQESKKLQTQLKKLQTQIKLINSQAEIQGEIETIDTKIEAIKTKIDKISWVELINKLKNVQNSIELVSKSIEQLPITQGSKTLQTQLNKSQTKIKLIYTQLINHINPKINAIKNQIGTSSIRSLSIDLKSVQTQIKAIQNIIKHPQIEKQQTRIEQIYAQLVEIIKKQLETISVKTDTTTLIVMASKLDEIQKQIWAIHKPIKLFYDKNSSPYKWVNQLQTQIETFYDQLVDKIQQQIEIINKLALNDTNDGVSLTIKLEDIQTQIDNVQKLLDKLADIPEIIKLQKQIETQQIWIGMTYHKLIDYIQTEIDEDIPANCADKNSQRSKLKAFQTLIVEIQKRIGKSIKTPNMLALKTRLELQHRKVIKYLTQIASCPDVDKEPKCLSSVSENMRNKLPMSWVPPMQDRSIPPYLRDWIKGITKITEAEFFIMRREVKISEFQDYVDTLSPEDKQKLENFWRQDDFGEELPIENPVASVPWWAAKGYADWLSKKTNCPLTLPTYHQWVAASISYANPEVAVIRDRQFIDLQPRQRIDNKQASDDKSKTSDNLFESLLFEEESTETSNDAVWDLLGNLREWSIDNKCPDKNYHYILGEDYNTWLKNISGKPICETGISDMIGFRLVLSLKKSIKR